MNKMKLLFYSLNFLPRDTGGMENHLFQIINYLKTKNQIILLLPSKHNILIEGVKIYRTPEIFSNSNELHNKKLFDYLKGLIAIIFNSLAIIFFTTIITLRKKIDLINIYQASLFATLITIISKIFRKKVVLNLRGPEGFLSKLNQIFIDSSILVSNFIIINSPHMLEGYKKNSCLSDDIFKKKKTFFLPNGIDIHFWSPSLKNEREKVYDIVFVGNLTDISHIINKGFKTFYDAIIHFKKKYGKTLKVLILGKYDLNLLKKMINVDIENFFIFKGFIRKKEKLKDEIYKSKIFVLSSRSEGMPNSLMEAMALEMPCIASNVGAINQLIDNNINGMLFKAGNHFELANMIFELLSNIEIQKRLGTKAREKIVLNYNLDKIVNEKITSLYKSIISSL